MSCFIVLKVTEMQSTFLFKKKKTAASRKHLTSQFTTIFSFSFKFQNTLPKQPLLVWLYGQEVCGLGVPKVTKLIRAKLKFIIRFVSLHSPGYFLKTSKYFWNTSHLYTTFIYLLHAVNIIKHFLIQARFPFDWGCLFSSVKESLMEMNRANICCKSINMPVSIKDGLCQQLSKCAF